MWCWQRSKRRIAANNQILVHTYCYAFIGMPETQKVHPPFCSSMSARFCAFMSRVLVLSHSAIKGEIFLWRWWCDLFRAGNSALYMSAMCSAQLCSNIAEKGEERKKACNRSWNAKASAAKEDTKLKEIWKNTGGTEKLMFCFGFDFISIKKSKSFL